MWLLENEEKYGKDTFSLIASHVTSLYINKITILESRETVIRLLQTFINVRRVCLACDIFSHEIRKEVMSLAKLEHLLLNAKVIEEDLELVMYETSLTEVEMVNLVEWSYSALSWLQYIPSLTILNLRFSRETKTFPLLVLPKLTSLSIESNNFSIPLSCITSFTSPISHLKVQHSFIDSKGATSFATELEKMTDLRIFSVEGQAIHPTVLSYFKIQGYRFIYQRQDMMKYIAIPVEDGRVRYLASESEEVKLIAPEIYQTLDYARKSMKSYEDTGDLVRTATLANVLSALRDLYIRDEKD